MGREELTVDDQEQLEYIEKWWERKRKQQQERKERMYKRKNRIRSAMIFLKVALNELWLCILGK